MSRLWISFWHRLLTANLTRRKEAVALLLAFTLTTHPFWCVMNFLLCSQPNPLQTVLAVAPVTSAAPAINSYSAPHSHADVCCGDTDEHLVLNATAPAAPPALLLVFLPLLWFALLVVFIPLLPRGAMVFGRDGPVRVRPLHSRLVRSSLPHRAPPVLLF